MRIRIKRWRRRAPDDLPGPPLRQRLLMAALAVAVSVVVGWAIVAPQLQAMRARADAAAPRPCAPGQTQGCIGGTMAVQVLPASAPRPGGSAPLRARARPWRGSGSGCGRPGRCSRR